MTMASRRALFLSSALFRCPHTLFYYSRISGPTASSTLSLCMSSLFSTSLTLNPNRHFHSTTLSLLSPKTFNNDADKIDPDTILFEGCDYKHWLIVMDFPHDPQQRPPAEQMVDTYVQTLANVVGSVEEAKKRMYACSTTTYTGFQAEIDEETSKKFEGMPGVLFVLPDSYIDPVNKEYGGDKYINGTIIPRPPPVQYGRFKRGNRQNEQRVRDPMPNHQQGGPAYNQSQGDGKGYMPQQQGFAPQQRFPPQQSAQGGFPPQQGFPPQHGQNRFPQQGQQGFQPQQGYPPQPGQQGFQPQQGYPPQPGQQGFQPQQGYPPQQSYPPHQGGYPPQQQRIPSQQSYGVMNHPGGGRDSPQSSSGVNNHTPSTHPGYQTNEYNHMQGHMAMHPAGDQRFYARQGPLGPAGVDSRSGNYPSPAGGGAYGQTGTRTFDQGGGPIQQHGPGSSGTYNIQDRAGLGRGGYGPPDGQNQRSAQIPDEHGSARSYEPTGHPGMNQGRN